MSRPFPLDKATAGQLTVMSALQKAIECNERLFAWWMGGVRSGKSFGAAMAFLEHCRHREQAQYILLAYTAGQAAKIYGPYFETIGKIMGMTVHYSRSTSDPKIEVWPDGRPHKRGMTGGNTFLLRGADKEGRDRAIQGLTVDGLLADEVPLLHRPTLHQAEARVSKPGGLRIYTSNKQSEYHWTAKYYLKRINEGSIDGMVIDSHITENTHIDSDYIAERSAEFTGDTLKRFMDNEFTTDGTPIYPMGIDMTPCKGGQLVLSIYGHPGGFEVATARIKKSKGPMRVVITAAASYAPSEDVVTMVKGADRERPAMILLNAEQPLLARKLRANGFTVKAYRSGWQPAHGELLADASRQGHIWVHGEQSSLVEAVKTYNRPGQYIFPVVQAVEALALPLRSFIAGVSP